MQYLDIQVQTIYSELLASCAGSVFCGRGLWFSLKKVKGSDYWYLNISFGKTTQHYIGPDNEATRRTIEQEQALWNSTDRAQDRSRRAQLVAMYLAGGGTGLTPAEGKLFVLLERAGIFLAGGVLVGTHAFRSIGNNLGVKWDSDLRIAADWHIPVAIPAAPVSLIDRLRDSGMGFLEVPVLDRRSPNTSFKLRKHKLTVEVLTPETGNRPSKPVYLQAFNTYGTPLRYLDYLFAGAEPAVLPHGFGVYARVPNAARFAFHKCAISQGPGRQKSKNDLAQAEEVLAVLVEDKPGELLEAYDAARRIGEHFMEDLNRGLLNLKPELVAKIRELVTLTF